MADKKEDNRDIFEKLFAADAKDVLIGIGTGAVLGGAAGRAFAKRGANRVGLAANKRDLTSAAGAGATFGGAIGGSAGMGYSRNKRRNRK